MILLASATVVLILLDLRRRSRTSNRSLIVLRFDGLASALWRFRFRHGYGNDAQIVPLHIGRIEQPPGKPLAEPCEHSQQHLSSRAGLHWIIVLCSHEIQRSHSQLNHRATLL
jgi:hypothetical protein